MKTSQKTRAELTLDRWKAKILPLGLVRPGSLFSRYMPCGKAGCRCMREPPALHGPYFQWTHKIGGKTVSRRLSEAQARVCAVWIRDHQTLRALVRQMEALSLRETDRLLARIAKEVEARKSAQRGAGTGRA